MPNHVERRGRGYVVVDDATGEVKSHHRTKRDAEISGSIRARGGVRKMTTMLEGRIAKAARVGEGAARRNLVFGWANVPYPGEADEDEVAKILTGSLSDRIERVTAAYRVSFPNDPVNDVFTGIEAVFDDHVITSVWAPDKATRYFRFDYEMSDEGEVTFADEGAEVDIVAVAKAKEDEPERFEKAETKREGGEDFPASAFAYVPDRSKPSTWKLRLWDSVAKKETAAQVGRAVAALGTGFRGQKVEIPDDALAGVKSRVRAAWNRVHGEDDELPAVLKAAPKTDLQGDRVELQELEDAAYHFVLTSRRGDVNHDEQPVAALVESFLVTPEKLGLMGLSEEEAARVNKGWWLGFRVDDATMDRVEAGELEMFSIGGHGRREPAAD